MYRLLAIIGFITCYMPIIGGAVKSGPPCPCASHGYCQRVPQGHVKQKMEAYVVTEGKSDYQKWVWDHITMVLNDGPDNNSLMCHAHSLRVGYVVMETMPLYTNYTDNANYTTWLNTVSARTKNMFADGVAVDLLQLLGQCQVDHGHIDLVTDAVHQLYNKLQIYQGWPKLFCIVPWRPPCYGGQCHLSLQLEKNCDYFVTNPDSFITSCNTQCRAQATIPKGRMVFGLDEYLAAGVEKNKLLMGVPWHGYDYKCQKVEISGDTPVCVIPKKNGTQECDFESSRTRLMLGDIMKTYPKKFKSHKWDGLQAAPYFNWEFQNSTLTEKHQIWFEAVDSLLDKYRLAKQTGIEGVVIWTADDLTNQATEHSMDVVWSWMVHTLFLTSSNVIVDDTDIAGKVAGIGVGCFLGGCLFGFVVTCIAHKRRARKLKLRGPFEKDDVVEDEYHDDDDNL